MLAITAVLVNDDCMYREGARDFMAIHEAFSETEYGQTLAGCVRYDKYRPEGVSMERWEELLGPDVNNLAHLADTHELVGGFTNLTDRLQPGLLTGHDKAVLKVGGVMHDWGESIKPDVNYFDKTEADEIAEREAFIGHLALFYQTEDQEVQGLITEALEEVIFDTESRLGKIFNTVERIGYVRTGLRADKHARDGTAPDCEDHLRWLATAVFSSDHIATLIDRGNETHAAHHFLLTRHDDLETAYATAQPDTFTAHEPPEAAALRTQGLAQAQAVWAAWRGGLEAAAIDVLA